MNEPLRQRLKNWFGKSPGRYLLAQEQEVIAGILPTLFGFHIMQIGSLCEPECLNNSRISHQIFMLTDDEPGSAGASVKCDTDSLCIASNSIDVVLLPHVLEFCSTPHKLLREVERILIGEGHLVISVFNPLSFCGLWRLFLAWRDEPPWNGSFFSYGRIKDWLTLLDLEIVRMQRIFYRPPVVNNVIMRNLNFMEKLGSYCWPWFGGVHVIVAKKRVIPLTPVRENWYKRRKMIASGVIEPTAQFTRDT